LFFEEKFKVKNLIGFKAKTNKFTKSKEKFLNLKDFELFLANHIDSDSEIDFIISPIKTYKKQLNRISGWAFQLKRFGYFQDKKDTDGLIEFLEGMKRKYSKNDSNLVIFFDGHKGISLKKICHSEKLKDFPFASIMVINMNIRTAKKGSVDIGHLWPIYGYNRYDAIEALKNMTLKSIEDTQ
jgi:hypothetical protein